MESLRKFFKIYETEIIVKINGIVGKVLRTYCDEETFSFSLLRPACDVNIAGESEKEKKIEQKSFFNRNLKQNEFFMKLQIQEFSMRSEVLGK